MTITLHGLKPGSQKATNSKGRKTYTEVYELTSDVVTNPNAVGTAVGILIGDQYTHDATCYCTDINPTEASDSGTASHWEVAVTYTDERRLDNDPLSDELRVSYTGEIYQLPLWADAVTGKPATNSAGDYFLDPSLTTDSADLVAHIKLNVSAVPSYALTLQNTVSNSLITISDNYSSLVVPSGMAKTGIINIGDVQFRNNQHFYPIQFDIYLRQAGWVANVLDAGFREIKYGKLVQVKNEGDDEEVTSPAPLANGKAIPDPGPDKNVLLPINRFPTGNLKLLPGVS